MGKVAVVGAGPAGIAATIQLIRYGHEVQVYEKGRVSGALWNARRVDNYPGFPEGISGSELANQMEKQFLSHVDNIIINEVEEIRKTDAGFSIMGMDFDGVILCTGTTPKKAEFPGEDELADAGLLHYGIAEVDSWRGVKEVAVIGGGEASIDMSLNLAENNISVTLIYRSELRGIISLKELAFNEEGITRLEGEVKSAGIDEKAVVHLDNRELRFDRVIVSVGREVVLPQLVGFSIDHPPPRMLVAGDATRGNLGQVAMAVGDGVQAAIAMSEYLEERN